VLIYVEINSDRIKKLIQNSFRPFDGWGLWPRRPGFDPRLVLVGYVKDEVHFDWFLS
jgi:hypothetical protein